MNGRISADANAEWFPGKGEYELRHRTALPDSTGDRNRCYDLVMDTQAGVKTRKPEGFQTGWRARVDRTLYNGLKKTKKPGTCQEAMYTTISLVKETRELMRRRSTKQARRGRSRHGKKSPIR